MKLLAPNGKPSNLTPEQYRLVRTPAFKKWFGDWEKSPETASKIIDENGEPLVCYHGSNKNISKFMLSKIGTVNSLDLGNGFYFTQNIKDAKMFSRGAVKKIGGVEKTIAVFLNLKDPLDFNSKTRTAKEANELWGSSGSANEIGHKINSQARKYKYDGIIRNREEIVAFYPNQIKLADGTNTTFDGSNPDIRFDDGGGVYKGAVMKIDKDEYSRLLKDYDSLFIKYMLVYEVNEYNRNNGKDVSSEDLEEEKKLLGQLKKIQKKSPIKFGLNQLLPKVKDDSRVIWHKIKLGDIVTEKEILDAYDEEGYSEDSATLKIERNNKYILKYIPLWKSTKYDLAYEASDLEHKDRVEEYAEQIINGEEPAPIIIDIDGNKIDGAHRIASYNEVGRKKILAFVEISSDVRFEGGGNISKTPAPKSERIYGSKVNKPKSSESKSKAGSIILSPPVIKSINTILKEHNEDFPKKKVPLSTAKAVVRRGMGAFSSSYRPTISGGKPNSRVAWGLARLKAFVYKIQKGYSKSGKYKQDNDLIEELGYKYDEYKTGGELENNKTFILTTYFVSSETDTDSSNIYNGTDYERAKLEFDSANITDFDGGNGGMVLFQKVIDKYKFIGDLEDGYYEISDFPIEDYYNDKDYYKIIENGEFEHIDSKDVAHINNESDDLLHDIESYYQKTYGNWKYNKIIVDNGKDENDDDYKEYGCIQLRITNHSENVINNDKFGSCDYYISVVIANKNPTKDKFLTSMYERRRNEIELRFNSDNSFDEIINEIDSEIANGKLYIAEKLDISVNDIYKNGGGTTIRKPKIKSKDSNSKQTLYHGGHDIGSELILRTGYYGGKKTGVDSGAIFFTPSIKYANQYLKHKDGLYKYELEVTDNIFDGTNENHYLRLKDGFIKNWQDEYSSIEDAISDYENAVNSIKSSLSYGAIDWATGSQFLEQISNSGFEGIKFLERPAENIETNNETGEYELSGNPVYSYALFKDEIKVDRFGNGGQIKDLLSSQEVEDKLDRGLDLWNDDIVYLSGIKYKKVYLRPEYKKVI